MRKISIVLRENCISNLKLGLKYFGFIYLRELGSWISNLLLDCD